MLMVGKAKSWYISLANRCYNILSIVLFYVFVLLFSDLWQTFLYCREIFNNLVCVQDDFFQDFCLAMYFGVF